MVVAVVLDPSRLVCKHHQGRVLYYVRSIETPVLYIYITMSVYALIILGPFIKPYPWIHCVLVLLLV